LPEKLVKKPVFNLLAVFQALKNIAPMCGAYFLSLVENETEF
jgi:hypothetical protein